MKCWNRSTLGVVVGILFILTLIAATVDAAFFLVRLGEIEPDYLLERNEIARRQTIFSLLIVLYLIMVIICALFILGIIKRLHNLMMPWLILSAIGFVFNSGRIMFEFVGTVFYGVPFPMVVDIFVEGVIVTTISALLFWPIFTLFEDMRKNNIEGRGRKLTDSEEGYKSPENY